MDSRAMRSCIWAERKEKTVEMQGRCRCVDRERAKSRGPAELDTELERNGTGAEEKVHRGRVSVEKHPDKSEGNFYTVYLGNQVKVNFFSLLYTGI